jgi:hypothetical protein
MGALVVVLVSAHHQVEAEAAEQRQPLLPEPEIGAIELVRGADRHLVHAHDDPSRGCR